MNEVNSSPSNDPVDGTTNRCPVCDSVVAPDAVRCLMCGETLRAEASVDFSASNEPPADPKPVQETAEVVNDTPELGLQSVGDVPSGLPEEGPSVLESEMKEHHSRITWWMVSFFLAVTVILGILVLQRPPTASVAFFPTATNPAATITRTPTWTPLPTNDGLLPPVCRFLSS